MNDQTSSISNNRGVIVYNYEHADHKGVSMVAIPKGGANSGKYSNLALAGWNDRISSHS